MHIFGAGRVKEKMGQKFHGRGKNKKKKKFFKNSGRGK